MSYDNHMSQLCISFLLKQLFCFEWLFEDFSCAELHGNKMDFAKLEVFTPEDLKACTDNFNIKSLVGVIQFGKIYRGKIKGVMSGTEGQDVMVKIWDKKSENMAFPYDEYLMVKVSS